MLHSCVLNNTLATTAKGEPNCTLLKCVTIKIEVFWRAQHLIQPPSLAADKEFQHTHVWVVEVVFRLLLLPDDATPGRTLWSSMWSPGPAVGAEF